ncbi:AAA family ATPase, partial [Chloroflexota bacterium]
MSKDQTVKVDKWGVSEQDQEVIKIANEVLENGDYEVFMDCFPINSPEGKTSAVRWLQGKLKGTGKAVYVYEDYIVDINNVPEPDWIVNGLVVREGLTLLYADAGVGKTTMMLFMTDCLQKGKDFLKYPLC